MRRGRAARAARSALALCGAAMLFCAVPPAAGADVFGPISLASEGVLGGGEPQQAEYAHDAAISGDGRYVAFDGSVGGVTGVWRRDVASGVIEAVAGGDAELPSVSESGRYISFTSTEDLAPEDEAHGVNVWVRDMEPGPGEPEYILVSAVNHSTKDLTYAYGASPPREEELEYGAVAAGRSAISANGQEVAFVTTAVSDLVLSEAEADGEEPVHAKTPAFQVAVRDIPAEETTLISGEYEPLTGETTDRPVSADEGGVPVGAVYQGQKSFRPVPANGGWQHGPPGASISADGSTVAWMGENIGRQARMLPGESPSPLYTEPLWRRIAPGSQTPTERVTGGSDPGNPACVASGELGSACEGPFTVSLHPFEAGKTAGIWSEAGSGGGQGDPVPRLSATGEEVAFISSALPVAIGAGFGTENAGEPADLYVVDMDSNPTRLTRDQALTPLTRIGGADEAADEPITDFDISPNGDQVAFTTARIEFPLGSPAYVSEPAAEAGESELFDVDLTNDTLTRVTHGYNGGPSEQPHPSKVTTGGHDPYQYGLSTPTTGAQSPSFTAGGEVLAFSSTASNLVYGDGNTPVGTREPEKLPDGSDAFVVQREAFDPLPTPQYISPAPPDALTPRWSLSATALSRPDGSVLLYVEVPGPGTLYAAARGSVLVRSSARTAKRRHTRRASHRADPRETVATRTLASSSKRLGAGGGEVAELVLRLARPYAPLAARGGGLSAEVSLTFTASGHPALRQSIATTFLRTAPAHASRRSRASVRRRGTRR